MGRDFIGAVYPEGAINGLATAVVMAFDIDKHIVFQGLCIVDNIFEGGDHAEGDLVFAQALTPFGTIARFENFPENSAEFFGVFKADG